MLTTKALALVITSLLLVAGLAAPNADYTPAAWAQGDPTAQPAETQPGDTFAPQGQPGDPGPAPETAQPRQSGNIILRQRGEPIEPLPPGIQSMTAAARVPSSMRQSFEGVWPAPGWDVFDQSDTDGGQYLWGKRDCAPHTGSSSIISGRGGAQGGDLLCGENAPNNSDSWAVYGPFDLSRAVSAQLTFHLLGDTEYYEEDGLDCRHDYLYVGYASSETYQNRAGNFYGEFWCGYYFEGDYANGYYQGTLDLGEVLGKSDVYIAFAFGSDGQKTSLGISIDDVILTTRNLPSTSQGGRVYIPIVGNQPLSSRPQHPACNDIENNDLPADAKRLTTLGGGCIGSLQDDRERGDDYYWIELRAGQRVDVALTDIAPGADFNIGVYSPRATRVNGVPPLARSKQPDQQNEQFVFEAPVNGRYYIRINSWKKSTIAPNEYVLWVSIL